MSPSRIDKIGSKSLLDKQWNEKPTSIIKNPHKLTEIELYSALEKIVEMPEKRLKAMMKKTGDNSVDEVFIDNIIQRIPLFLTATLVNFVKVLLIQKDFFKDHVIWKVLEQEIYKRRNNLNNEQLATVIHGFGITGNGSKEFYSDFEEVIIDSPIQIETQYLEKIIIGYTQIDRGSPVLYADTIDKILYRGIENLEYLKISEIAKNLSRATNVHKAGYGFFQAMEKYFHKEMDGQRISFEQICKIAENILPFNIGSNKFQEEMEQFIMDKFNTSNLQNFTDLLKGLSSYKIKNEQLNDLIYQTVAREINEFTMKQLEILIWSLSRCDNNNPNPNFKLAFPKYKDLPEPKRFALTLLIEKIKQKSPSMKPRGVAFALESLQNLEYKNEEVFKWMEKVVLAKMDEFIPHYLVKILSCYYNMGYGSGKLYEKLSNNIIDSIVKQELKYSDMLKFFEIYPRITHIYNNTMNVELFQNFVKKIKDIIQDKKFPTTDVCRTFNILVGINSFYQPSTNKKDEFLPIYTQFMFELIGKLRHSVFDIPKELFTLTLSNLIEFNLPEIANKFIFIIEEVVKNKKLSSEFESDKERIELFWSLIQLDKVFKSEEKIISQENLQFLNDVDLNSLEPRSFILYKQLVCLLKMWIDQQTYKFEDSKQMDKLNEFQDSFKGVDFDQIYKKFENISLEKREQFLNEDEAIKTSQQTLIVINKFLKEQNLFLEINQNVSDDLINLIHIGSSYNVDQSQIKQDNDNIQGHQLYGVIVLNKHCYIQSPNNNEKIIKSTINLKKQILETLFLWDIIFIDEEQLLKEIKDKKQNQYLEDILQIQKLKNHIQLQIKSKQIEQPQKQENKDIQNLKKEGGRKIKTIKNIIK